MPTWDEMRARAREADELAKLRPHARMLASHGNGPAGRACGECAHLIDKADYQRMTPGRYFKCLTFETGKYIGGPSTDWRKKWPACGKFEERKETR